MKRILALLVATFLLLPTCFGISCFAEGEQRGIIYVATNGNDSAAGTMDAPLASLHGARDKIRALKASGISYPKGFVVYVRGGNYSFSESFVLTEEDSGTPEAPIVYRAYDNEKVTFSGGVAISGSQMTKLTDPALCERIVDTAARDKIYMIDLKSIGITDVGKPYWKGAYSYPSYFTNAGLVTKPKAPASELFFNGEAMTIARYPNSTNLAVNKVIDKGWSSDEPDGYEVGAPFTITVDDARIKQWSKAPADSILMFGFWRYDWADQTVPIHKIDSEKMEITSTIGSCFGVVPEKPFYVFNLIEELDRPGEYYLDTDNCVLYLYPPSDISNASITMSLLEDALIQFDGASNIEFKNFNVTATRNHAILMESGENNKISGCEISYTASQAVRIAGTNNGIIDSYVHDVEAGIYLIGGSLPNLIPGNCYAINNHIRDFSRLSKTYKPAIGFNGMGNIATNNKIHSSPHEAIAYSGASHKMMYNEIYDVLKETDDAGVIYGGLNWNGRGYEIKYNYIHDIGTSSDGTVGIHGVYGDGGQCELYIMGNVFENIAGNAIHLNGGRDTVALNNIVINCANGFSLNDTMVGLLASNSLETHHYKGLKEHSYVYNCTWKAAFPKLHAMLEMTDEEKVKPEGNIYANNLHVNTPTATKLVGSAVKYLDPERNLVVASDPGFYDIKNRNYTLKEDSEVFTKLPGFEAIPFTRMGMYDERAKVRVQDAVAMRIESPYAWVESEKVSIDEDPAVTPILRDGVTYIPLRFLAESLGAEVSFDDATSKITIATTTTSLELSSKSTGAVKNGENVTLSSAPIVIADRTMVPLREISELFDKSVFWRNSGFIAISDDPTLFDEETGTDEDIISYLAEAINIY